MIDRSKVMFCHMYVEYVFHLMSSCMLLNPYKLLIFVTNDVVKGFKLRENHKYNIFLEKLIFFSFCTKEIKNPFFLILYKENHKSSFSHSVQRKL